MISSRDTKLVLKTTGVVPGLLRTGDVRVEAGYSVCGVLGKGMIDYAILYQHFSIVVVLEVSQSSRCGVTAVCIAWEGHKQVASYSRQTISTRG